MGFVCGPDGALLVLRPFSPMWIGPPDSSYLRRACFNCHCTNIAPDEPQPPAVQRPACVVDIGEDEVVGPVPSYPPNPQCKISTTASGDLVEEDDPPLYDLYRCNEYMYGKPIFADCDDAYDEMERYQNAWEAAQPADKVNYRPATFVGIGRLADFNSVYGANYDPELVQLPVARTNGTCTITIMQLERRHMPIFATEDWDTLLVNMQDVMFNCVEDQGIGGWVETGDLGTGEDASLGVFVYGPNSRFQQLLDIKFACTTDAEGNAECQDTDDDDGADDQRPSKTQKTGEWAPEGQGDAGQGGSSDPQPPAAQQCEVPCSHPSDCDTTNNYLCTSSSPLPDDPPIDPSFRAFCCQLVTELSDSVAASQALGPNTCRDRCLLANTAANATTCRNGTTWTNTTLEILAVPDRSYPGLALECPCNCTYVSPACCLSTDGVVFEDPSEKSPLGVQAPNRSVCCDEMTGGWREAAGVRSGYAVDPACPSNPSGVTGLELINA